jgi:hypothetical protein
MRLLSAIPVERLEMSAMPRLANAVQFAREVAFPVLAVAVIVAYADIRIPLGLPGHRGLVWLTLLVAVALVTCRRQTIIAVGAASTTATMMFGGVVNPWASGATWPRPFCCT